MYQCLLHLDRTGVYSSPWLNHIKCICNDCGMSGIWLTHDIINPNWFKKAIEQRLKDQWITTWNQYLLNKSICSDYRLYKDVLHLEKYLILLKKSDRITLSKLRASNNKLPVVTGRYNRVERENRLCTASR